MMFDVFDDKKEDGCGMRLMDASNAFKPLIVKQRFGMLEYCGLDVLDLSSILTEASRRFSLLAPMKWHTVGNEQHRETH